MLGTAIGTDLKLVSIQFDLNQGEIVQLTANTPGKAGTLLCIGCLTLLLLGVGFNADIPLPYPLTKILHIDTNTAVEVAIDDLVIFLPEADTGYFVQYTHIIACVLVRKDGGITALVDGLNPKVNVLSVDWLIEE